MIKQQAVLIRNCARLLQISLLLAGIIPLAPASLGRPTPPPPQAQISVAISPSSYGLTVNQSILLAATVVNDSLNRGVTWSVSGSGCSGNTCGTLSGATSTTVTYTAPSVAGVYVVTATSVSDPTKTALADMGVTDLAGVFTYRNDGTRTSTNSKEYLLTPSNVNTSSFGKLFTCLVDGSVYAQPLWVSNAAIGGGVHNIVIVATQHDSVYAFDADNGSGTTCTQYWKATMLTAAYGAASGATPVPPSDTGETGDIPTEIGITSTPVIDPTTHRLFVVSKTKEGGQYFQRLHRLNLADGTETTSSPVVISASVTGSGTGSSGNSLPYIALHQNQRPGLALVNGIVYIASGSHGDIQPWHGWIIGYNASTMAFSTAYCTTPNSNGGGVWMSGSAPVFDSSNNLYVISSNGNYDGNTEFGDSFLKFSTSSGLTRSDWFTPDNQSSLSANNIDLGQGGAVTLLDSVSGPFPHLVIGGGKGGVLYLVNRDNMGHFHSSDNNQTVQNWSLGNMIASSGTFWQNTFYIGAANSPLQAFAFNTSTDTFNTAPTSQSNAIIAFPGLTPVVSAEGTSNGIIWAVDSSKSGTNGAASGPAVLYAFDPNNLGNELWDSSKAAGNRDQAANAVKFVVPTVANGKVYVGAVNALNVYGLLSLPPSVAPPTFNPGPGGYTTAQNVSILDSTSGATIHYTLDGSTPTTSSPVYMTPINVTGNMVINAMAVAPGLNNSPVATGAYTIGAIGNGSITFVQGNYAAPQASVTNVSVPYQGPQTAGDLNVVVVGWNDSTASVSSVVDSNGNNYTLAIGPTRVSGFLSQSIYYLANIPSAAAGTNSVKVTFNTPAAYPDVRILEYYGADPSNPIDVTTVGTGSTITSSTPAVATTNANDLLFAANMVTSTTTGPGAGFTNRMITAPDGDIVEDRLVVATGSYSASAPENGVGQWIMQMVAFRAAGSGGTDTTPPTPPTNLVGPGPIVQATQGYINSTALTTHTTAPFDSTGGDLIVVFASSHAGVTMTPSDSFHNTWVSAAGPTNTSTGFDLRSQIWYAKNPTVGAGHTFTLTLSAAQSLVISIFVVQGSNIPAPIDAISTIGDDAGTQTLNVTSPSVTTVNANDLLLGWAKSSVSETFTSGPGFTPQPTASSNFLDSESGLGAPPSSYHSTFTLSTAATWQAAIVAVDPSASATSTSTEIDLTWSPSTDNVGVTGYMVERCQGLGCSSFAQIATTIGTLFNDTGLAASTTYSYRVRATDGAGNLSGYSNTVTATTQPSQVPVPTVTSVSPSAGTTAGGTAVTITGTNFAAGATVTFGSNAATNVVVVSSTQITATTPAGSLGAATVTVTANGQSGSLAGGFTYVVPATVTSVSPGSGTTAGGTAVTITGTNFAAGAAVTFGGNAATNVVVVSSTQITATTPAGAVGAVTVTVTNPGVTGGSLASGFTYVVIPTVTSVSPNTGTTAGGTSVTITGANFGAGATVTFGSNAATNVVVVSSTQITATTPAGSAGAVTVTVTVNGQSGSLTNGFTYVVPPTVTSVSPSAGTTAGGTSVTITGTNFAAGTTVTFGSNAATNVVVVSSTQITATTPAGAVGAVTVTVTNPGVPGGSLVNGYTYVVVPTVSSISPNNGPIAGGTAVTITGTNFAAGATVTIGGTAATNVVVVSSTQITATTPAHAAGAVTVTVTVNSQAGSLANGYTYNAPPTVSNVSPNNGPVAGGTAVTITGTNFAAGATVTFGSNAATNVVVVSGAQITATTPAGSVGAVTVTVTVNGQAGSLASGFTYNTAVAISFGQVAAATPQSSTATVPVTFPGPQTAGDLNIVVVGWNDTTSAVQSVKDSAGNTYNLAIGPTVGTALQQSIYYAANIAGGSNTVTVTFNQAAAFPDVRILEYRGVTTLDAKVGASGNSTAANSGTATTTSANELIFGANTVFTLTNTAGSGFTSRIITSDGDIAEDKVVTTAGSNSATATLTSSGPWVMQMVTFSAVTGPAPTVTSVSPNNGTTAGGTAVTITGTNFAAGAAVTFSGIAATNVAVVSGTQITATTPAGSAGAVTVAVTVNGQAGSLASGFTYVAPPTVTSVSPSAGTTAGGTAVTITGTNFAAGATVTFGSNAATNVVVVSSTQITATTPAGSLGAATVTVTVNGQSGSLTNGFSYVAPATVSSVSPSSGTTAGGTSVTITGTNFAAGATVTFGSNAATNVVVVSSTQITATTPAGAVGAVTVTVTNPGVAGGSLASGFTYVVVPTVTSVAPNTGTTAGGTSVTITGANFGAGATVTFGSNAATNVVVMSGTQITATTPAGSAGAVTVTVTVNGQSGSLTNGFTYVVPPTVTSVSPNSGTTAGGTSVTITGTNFAAGATVTFGSNAATNVVVVSSTQITATTPAGGVGAVTVTVTNPGVPGGSLVNGYTYVVVPTVSSISPNNGPAAGGTSVTITGTNFAAGATVTIGGTAATNVVVVSSTQITATTPAHAAGAVTVTVTVNSQAGSLTNGYTYNAPPTVTSVSPNNGPVAGGTAVTITGTNFAAGAGVTFGGNAATNVVVVSATQITATTPAGSVGAVTVTVTVNGQAGSLASGYTYSTAVAISFGQVAAATPQSSTATVPVTFPGAQTAGDLNIVVVGWNDTTSTVQSVKDSAGNTYNLAIGPTVGTGLQQSIYYAANIAGGSNTVTVTFNQAAAFPDVRILEYRGVTALDAKVGAVGTTTAMSSGTATTTSANELIFGASTVATVTSAAGTGFTSRIITNPDADIAEDKVVTVAGSNSATATLSFAGPWVMQMVTFK